VKALEAELKKLKGAVTASPPHSFLTTSSAKNDALCKAAAAKENIMMMIPRPPSGSGITGNGFNLQVAMHLEDNSNLYTALHVS
jgi:hypothetical protein